MPVRKKTSTTRLPQSLRDELDGNTPNNHPRTKWTSRPKVSRKDSRKEERTNRKKNKADFFSHHPGRDKRSAEEEEHAESPKRKKARHDISTQSTDSRSTVHPKVIPNPPETKAQDSAEPSSARRVNVKKTRTPLERLVVKSNPLNPKASGTRREEEEDSYIAYLESKLGYAKDRKKQKKTEDDGLDDLLDWATSFGAKDRLDEEMEDIDGASDDESYDENPEDGKSSGDDERLEDNRSSESLSDEEWQGIGGGGEEQSPTDEPHASTRNAETGTRYVPPHLRNALRDNAKDSEVMVKLSKQLKGLLNRMSEQNMATILDSVEEIYRDNRRNDVTTTLTNLIIQGIASHSSLLDSYVVLYAAFVSSLHKIIGVEFAAYFVQNVVSLYERYHAALSSDATSTSEDQVNDETKGKECSNLLVLLSELYNFQVISSVLVFDIIRGLLRNELTEFGVELLLKIVRNSGQQLRQDDPSALKDIIQTVQSKVSDKDEALSSRTRFMIETLTNLKNNKLKRNATQNQGAEAVERMKKFLSGLSKKRHVLAHDPLRVSLGDLHSAGTKGKWWLVGAAWSGDPLVDRQAEAKAAKVAEVADPAGDLGKLARKQGMNTDIRKSIFVVLMSSDDYIDACERLSQLNLTEVQQREIVRVLLHCCGNEKTYNPYYALVCQHLCRQSHSYKITLQFCLWDFLRDLGETSVGGAELIKTLKGDRDDGFDLQNISKSRMRNVARAYGWWIAKDCVTLAILKPVDFTLLKPQTREFLREMMIQIFISSQRETPMISSNPKDVPTTRNRGALEEIFIKATRIQNLAMGLVYFLSEAFRDLSGEEEGLEKLIKWASGLAKDTLRTGVDIVPNL
ncbi:Suppressor of glycerol defect protein 1 [Hypsizygus marmoreus]|uniref:Suppressor of glycerol defect protein 1 n=1 Tax=Hypsizygus marmoreus TaxID=39966 RepID=A0A369JUD8_HYPMA|nr:Suppressor of glycerol defect protein 1 [Hypsizygus marmoreus]